jgi:hypothetical protein
MSRNAKSAANSMSPFLLVARLHELPGGCADVGSWLKPGRSSAAVERAHKVRTSIARGGCSP